MVRTGHGQSLAVRTTVVCCTCIFEGMITLEIHNKSAPIVRIWVQISSVNTAFNRLKKCAAITSPSVTTHKMVPPVCVSNRYTRIL